MPYLKIKFLYIPSSTLALTSSLVITTVGNLPHFVNKGPPNFGNCLTRVSETNKSLYFLDHFFNSFPFLSAGSAFFFKLSASMNSIPCSLHLSMWAASAMTQTFILGLGTFGKRTVPLKRLKILINVFTCLYLGHNLLIRFVNQ
jgi:multidrug transporter EmrE-like cation transporter